MRDATAWRTADACWQNCRMDGSRAIFGCWAPRWPLWRCFCCWGAEDEFAPGQRAYFASFCRRNYGLAAGAFGGARGGAGVRYRGGCVYGGALVTIPVGDDGDAG